MAAPFRYARTVHFPDTDAAGVVFFARYLFICHEAYEESLAAAGIELGTFFTQAGVVVPISKSEASYLRPLTTGDKLQVEVTPERLTENSFALHFTLWKRTSAGEKRAAVARTEHVCIDPANRERHPLPPALAAWLDAKR